MLYPVHRGFKSSIVYNDKIGSWCRFIKNWRIKQENVKNIFLQPPSFINIDRHDFVCSLKKIIYSPKEASRVWYMELCQHLLHIGFVKSLVDTS